MNIKNDNPLKALVHRNLFVSDNGQEFYLTIQLFTVEQIEKLESLIGRRFKVLCQ